MVAKSCTIDQNQYAAWALVGVVVPASLLFTSSMGSILGTACMVTTDSITGNYTFGLSSPLLPFLPLQIFRLNARPKEADRKTTGR